MTPRRWPFFYGWVIVGVAFVGSGIGSGAAIWGPSVLLLPMTEDMEWSRAQFFSAFLVRELIAGFSAPFIGPLYDTKHGPRLLMGAGALILGASTALVSVVGELWQFVLLFGVGGGLAELGSGFYISQTLVPKWFVRHRGRALGVAIMGVGLGALVFPGVISTLIGSVGWRGAWVWFGVGIGSIAFVLSLFVRTRPEDVGTASRRGSCDGRREAHSIEAGGYRAVADAARGNQDACVLAAARIVQSGGAGHHWIPDQLASVPRGDGLRPRRSVFRHRDLRPRVRHRASGLGAAGRALSSALPDGRHGDSDPPC